MAELSVKKIRRVEQVQYEGTALSIGRSSGNAIVLPHRTVSRLHCIIEPTDDGCPQVRDLGSRYGIKVNGTKTKTAPLQPGDRIGIGPFEITFKDATVKRTTASVDDERGDLISLDSSDASDTGVDTAAADRSAVTEALAEAGKELAELRDEIAAKRSEIDQWTQSRQHQEQRLAERTGELEAIQAQLTEQQAELDEARKTLELDQQSLRDQTTTWEQSRSALEANQDRIADELEKLTGELIHAHADTEAQRQRAEEVEQRLQTHIEQTRKEGQGMLATAEAAESNLEAERQEHDRDRRELEARSQRLEKANATIVSLKEKLQELQAGQKDAVRRAAGAEQTLTHLAPSLQAIREASARLATMNESLRSLEEVWAETSEWVEDAQEHDPRTLPQAHEQQEAIAQQLEAAHRDRDQMVSQLQAMVDQCAVLAVQGPGHSSNRTKSSLLGRLVGG